jgi:hypothetical protein
MPHAPAPTPKGKMHLPLNRRLVGPQSQSGHFGEDNDPLPLLVFEHQIIQSIASHDTDCTILASHARHTGKDICITTNVNLIQPIRNP